jgi:hypothetical protein
MTQPIWLTYMFINIFTWAYLYWSLNKHGPKHCASYLALADIAGGFTVCAAVTVSSFLFEHIIAKGQIYVAAEPVLWLCIAVLASNAVVQVKYLNQALEKYDASVVVPTHYVLFSLASITGPSILYQELTMDSTILKYGNAFLQVTMFLLGIGLTFGGVGIISSGKGRTDDGGARALDPAAMDADDDDAASGPPRKGGGLAAMDGAADHARAAGGAAEDGGKATALRGWDYSRHEQKGGGAKQPHPPPLIRPRRPCGGGARAAGQPRQLQRPAEGAWSACGAARRGGAGRDRPRKRQQRRRRRRRGGGGAAQAAERGERGPQPAERLATEPPRVCERFPSVFSERNGGGGCGG